MIQAGINDNKYFSKKPPTSRTEHPKQQKDESDKNQYPQASDFE